MLLGTGVAMEGTSLFWGKIELQFHSPEVMGYLEQSKEQKGGSRMLYFLESQISTELLCLEF